MFSYDFYRVAHFLGIFLILASTSGQLLAAMLGQPKQHPAKKFLAISHGIGLLIALVAGFGLLAKLQVGFTGWVNGKIAIWILFGFWGAIAMRRRELARLLWLAMILLGVIAAYLARYKPF